LSEYRTHNEGRSNVRWLEPDIASPRARGSA
jgi:hypothetical protein